MSSEEQKVDAFFEAVNQGSPPARSGGVQVAPRANPAEAPDWAKTLAVASCWARSGESYFPVSSVVNSVPAGVYRCCMSNTGPYIEKMNVNIEHLIKLPDSATEELLAEFNKFWKLRAAFDKRGFVFKRGMLMWGPPGSGKTSAVWQMAERLVKDQEGIVVFIDNPSVAVWCLTAIRRIEPQRRIVTVMEDLDALLEVYGDHELLALMDGEFQLDNVVHVATTNYPHRIDRRFIDRPSRFDTVMPVGMPSAEARRVFLQAKEPELDEATIERWVENSEGFSIAHLKEVCIATQCFGQKEEEVFYRLSRMKEIIHLTDDGERKQAPGFTRSLAKMRRN